MGVLQEFLLPLTNHAGVQVEVDINGIELFVPPLDDSQDDLDFEFCGVLFLWHDNDLLFDLIMPQICI